MMKARAPEVSAPAGLLDALRAMGATAGELLRVRGALFAIELREEVARRKGMLVLALVGAVFLHMALVAATLLVGAIFWETHRVAAIAATCGAYLVAGAGSLLLLRIKLAASPGPFPDTLGELSRDLAVLGRPQ